MLEIKVTGGAEVAKKLRELAKKYGAAFDGALYMEGMDLWRESVKRAPVEFGVLRSSAYVAPPTKRGGVTAVEVGFGTAYAVPQHERTDYEHPRGGQAKYLESAIADATPTMLDRIARRAKALAESGQGVPALAAPKRPSAKAAGKKSVRRALVSKPKKRKR